MNPEKPRPQQDSNFPIHLTEGLQNLYPRLYVVSEINRRIHLTQGNGRDKLPPIMGLLLRVDANELLRRSQEEHTWHKKSVKRWEQFSASIDRTEHVFALADASGIILHSSGSPPWRAVHGILPGYDWSEPQMGPSGIGTALAERRPVLITGMHHFQLESEPVLALGVPVMDRGALLGALELRIGVSAASLENLRPVFESAFYAE